MSVSIRQIARGLVFAFSCLGLSILALYAFGKPPERWAQVAGAYGYDRERQQAILFRAAIEDGIIIDRSNLDLPRLNEEEEHGRRLNFDRCKVGMDVYKQSGAIKGWRFDDFEYRFALDVDPTKWASYDDQEGVLEMAQCYFSAGDSRVKLKIPVYGTNRYNSITIWSSSN